MADKENRNQAILTGRYGHIEEIRIGHKELYQRQGDRGHPCQRDLGRFEC